jgi:hypothetical protein
MQEGEVLKGRPVGSCKKLTARAALQASPRFKRNIKTPERAATLLKKSCLETVVRLNYTLRDPLSGGAATFDRLDD